MITNNYYLSKERYEEMSDKSNVNGMNVHDFPTLRIYFQIFSYFPTWQFATMLNR
jgi:hypothetical protein